MKLRRLTLALLTAACCLLTSCEEEDFVPPSFLSIDAIQLKPTPGVTYTAQDGFCSAELQGADGEDAGAGAAVQDSFGECGVWSEEGD